MNETYCRLKALLLGWGSVGVVYSTTDMLQRAGYKLPPLWVDTLLDFSPSAIWLYLSFFILIPLGYWLTPLSQVKCLMRATQLAALFAGVIYLAWPSTMDYPTVSGEGVSVDLLRLLLAVDSSQNCFPSLHMALTLLMVWGISRRGQWQYTLGAAIWGAAIAVSILQLRRHLFIDLVGGTALALLAGALAVKMTARRVTQEALRHE
ncbi:phosphatase PAP2 family protein [Cronobacter dublinensis]|uniref:phosphatase PAP2 family protein n=1 Tax=Cronobacter dublinensis TaxID=413497 RepID=UPI000D00615B|nr:phosphatase PAP2 family protein [Cronobacter dublinensis]ELY2795020.1 phosphatase PAP2 family protein [Cronobacter dublinensis]ELY3972572.1 phosphatase PAP2 family protein [Cronobacter dublinensis]ELY4484527.1 phosphatase PAP2 family protein [Cronobacter dublinensis]ELY5822442.1 phosphatase PAP2 family protein [Cronobacter dublinensis]